MSSTFQSSRKRNSSDWRSMPAGCRRAAPLQRRRGCCLLFLLLVALVGFFSGLGLLGFAFGTFFAFDFFLALLDDFGLGWSCAFCCDDFGRLLFFDLESDHVRENLFGIG